MKAPALVLAIGKGKPPPGGEPDKDEEPDQGDDDEGSEDAERESFDTMVEAIKSGDKATAYDAFVMAVRQCIERERKEAY